MIHVPVSVGELIDKLSILHVKRMKIINEEKLILVNKEFEFAAAAILAQVITPLPLVVKNCPLEPPVIVTLPTLPKLAPYTAATYDNMYRLYNKEKIDNEIANGHIEVIPLAFMRGRNLSNCCVVVDEGQNITHRQMELLLGRLCEGSRMVICGDSAQIDLKEKKMSGFNFICNNLTKIPGFSVVTLKTNHRDPIVEDIIKIYTDHRD